MSNAPKFKIDLTPKIKDRVLDPNREVKDFDDAIELGMYGAYEMSDYDDFKFLEQFKNIEMELGQNKQFVSMAQQMTSLKTDAMQYLPNTDSPEFAKALADATESLKNNSVLISLEQGQNKLRESAFKQIQPNQEFADAIKRITEITDEHKRVWNQGLNHHKQEADRLQKKIDEIGTQQEQTMQVEVAKSEMVMHTAELERATLLVKKADTVFVSDHYKKLEKHIPIHIDRDETKPTADDGMTLNQKKRINSIQLEYYRLEKHKTPQTAKNMVCRKYGITPKTLKKYLVTDPKLPE